MKTSKIIAVDFDGTIVEDAYPKIGKPRLFAFETLKRLEAEGYRLTLWTYRSGIHLKEAVAFCQKNGITFYAVNNSFEGEEFNNSEQSRKINADYFIDDRNVGGFPGWGEVYECLTKNKSLDFDKAERIRKKKKKSFLSFSKLF